MPSAKYEKNKTTELFRKLDKFIFFGSSMNYWVDDKGITNIVPKAYKNFYKLVNVAVVLFMVAEFGAFFTQNDLTEKQKSDRMLLTLSHFILYSFTLSLGHHKKIVTEVLFALAVELKKDFNDEDTERQMLKKTKFYACALVGLCFNALALYGIDGLYQVLFSDGTFVTIITVWPEVHDRRAIAGAARFGFYVLWWLWMLRVTTAYLLVLTITISLSHQYMNLQMYFKSIAGIFEERMSQSDKEKKFEGALKVGIRLHATTMWCTQRVQKVGGSVFSGHIIVNIGVLVLLMSQLQNSDRTLSNILPIVATAMSMLFGTGVLMWNAGDISVEAANLPTAIFLSGWQNCTYHSSYRVRRMLLIALAQSQKPVVMKSCGFLELSYQSYLSFTLRIINLSTTLASKRMMSKEESDVIFETLNNAGIITLNRPKALNSLNTSMVKKLFRQLQEWETTKTCVIVKGTGDKAFCAGGDVKAAKDKVEGPIFFHTEFRLNYLIGKYNIPYIAFIDGITMGGGMGLSVHGRYRVATEKTVVAMPETRIGLFPDVGGSYFLPRLQGNLGLYLGLTGDRLKGKDAVKAGIATHFVPSSRLYELETLLSQCSSENEINALLTKFNEPAEGFSLADDIKHINYCFAAGTIEEIIERLLKVKNEWSSKTLETLHSVCPGSLKITLRALRRGAQVELGQCLKMEYRVACRSTEAHDFPEGVRALLIDKDNSPKWQPATLAEVTNDYVESFFKTLPEDKELIFFD